MEGEHHASCWQHFVGYKTLKWEHKSSQGENYATSQPLFVGWVHLQRHGCLGHRPQPSCIVGARGQETEVKSDDNPGRNAAKCHGSRKYVYLCQKVPKEPSMGVKADFIVFSSSNKRFDILQL